MAIIEEGICIIAAKVGFDTSDGKIHLCHFPCGGVRVLTEHRNVVDVSTMVLNEFRTLDKHTAGAAAGVYHVAVFDTEWYVPGYAKSPIK